MWALGDGTTTRFWLDKWLDNHTPIRDIVREVPADMHDWKVVDLVDGNMQWRWDILKDFLLDRLINKLLVCPPPKPSLGPDVVYWLGKRSGKSFAWQVLHGRLPTKVYCSRWSGDSSDYHNCVWDPEAILHVLRDCSIATSVWQRLVPQHMRVNFFGFP